VTAGHHKRVLFVCIGNACRSQMAEAFARHHGSDILIPASAGLAPASALASHTILAMREKNLDIRGQYPKAIRHLGRAQFDLIVNMSGRPLPGDAGARVVEWEVPDPVLMTYDEHREIRDAIERRVVDLIAKLRLEEKPPRFRGQGSGRLEL
jgi:arsenate reductase (thioredoxin)